NSINSGYGIRMLSEGIETFSSVPNPKFAEKEIKKAISVSKLLTNWKKGIANLADAPVSEAEVVRKPKLDWDNLDVKEIEEKITNLNLYVTEFLKVEAEIETDIQLTKWSERFVNSEGSRVYQEFPYVVLTLTGRVFKNSHQVKYYKSYGGMGGIEVLPFDKPDETIGFVEVMNNLPQASLIDPGLHNSVLSEDMAWTLNHEVFGHSLEADNVLSGRSFSSGLQGMKIAPSMISVIDDPYIESLGYYEFDSEGVKGRGTLLVDEGILTDFLQSRITAAAMGTESSSNYRAYNFEYLPQVRMSNFFFEPKDFTEEELLETAKDGLYIGDGLGGSSEPQTGEYNLDAQYGREIKNGELGDYILQFQVSGRMLDTLSKIESIGNKLLAQPGSCVKNNQRVFVGSIGPKISVSEMRVS
ncbi:MAG: TldD/PmbA family protein, partial [Candidatus Heimdallarchaeaceae archaeon]